MKSVFFLLIGMSLAPNFASADPQKAKTVSQKNSKCSVKRESGEYPTYRVLKDGKAIFEPKSDGIVQALISPSGKYVALAAGEVSLIDLEAEKFEYGVVVVNCETGSMKGYRKGIPTHITRWEGNSGLHISEYLNLSGNSGETLP